MQKNQFIERVASAIIQKKKSPELLAKLEKLEKIVSYFTEQKITKVEALQYVLSEGSRNEIYRCTKHLKRKIIIT